jgi:hypothetical protein
MHVESLDDAGRLISGVHVVVHRYADHHDVLADERRAVPADHRASDVSQRALQIGPAVLSKSRDGHAGFRVERPQVLAAQREDALITAVAVARDAARRGAADRLTRRRFLRPDGCARARVERFDKSDGVRREKRR